MLAAAGIRAADPSAIQNGPLHQDGKPVGLAVEFALIALLTAVNRRRARFPEPPPHLPYTLNSILRFVLRFGVLGLPGAALLSIIHPLRGRPHRLLSGFFGRSLKARPQPPKSAGHLGIVIAEHVLPIVLLAAVVVCLVLILRWRRPAGNEGSDMVPDDDYAAQLRRAVDSGLHALAEIDDARGAIIACYVAMESSLAGVGAVRAAAETPDELLARASAGELVRGSAAGRLTALFYAARFSSRPLPQPHRAEAQLALTDLAAELGGAARTGLTARTAVGARARAGAQAGQGKTGA